MSLLSAQTQTPVSDLEGVQLPPPLFRRTSVALVFVFPIVFVESKCWECVLSGNREVPQSLCLSQVVRSQPSLGFAMGLLLGGRRQPVEEGSRIPICKPGNWLGDLKCPG
jgi:hypothetical protein